MLGVLNTLFPVGNWGGRTLGAGIVVLALLEDYNPSSSSTSGMTILALKLASTNDMPNSKATPPPFTDPASPFSSQTHA